MATWCCDLHNSAKAFHIIKKWLMGFKIKLSSSFISKFTLNNGSMQDLLLESIPRFKRNISACAFNFSIKILLYISWHTLSRLILLSSSTACLSPYLYTGMTKQFFHSSRISHILKMLLQKPVVYYEMTPSAYF